MFLGSWNWKGHAWNPAGRVIYKARHMKSATDRPHIVWKVDYYLCCGVIGRPVDISDLIKVDQFGFITGVLIVVTGPIDG